MRRFVLIGSIVVDAAKIKNPFWLEGDYIEIDLAEFLNIPHGTEVEAEDPVSALPRFLDLFPPPAYGGGEAAARLALARGLFRRPGPAFPCTVRVDELPKGRRAVLVTPTCPVCARRYKVEGDLELPLWEFGLPLDQRLWANRVMAIWGLYFPDHAITARHLAAVYGLSLTQARNLVREFRAMQGLVAIEED